jgi:ribosomal protein S18 acetylase RimI-like enzyme
MAFTIRPARPEEFRALGELTVTAYLDDEQLGFGPTDAYLDVLRDVQGRARVGDVLVAVDDDETILGGVTFVAEPGSFADIAEPGEAEFRTLAVAAAGRGRGVGSALVEHCIDQARSLRRSRLVLSTQPAMYAARHIYERFGFVRLPERDWSPMPGLSLFVYALELTSD